MRNRWIRAGGPLLALLAAAPPIVAAGERQVEIWVRDSVTGEGIAALVGGGGSGPKAAARAALSGRLSRAVPPGREELRVSAPGYRTLETFLDPGSALPVTVWLDPEAPPPPAAVLRPDALRIEGRVIDVATGRGLAGATVRLAGRNAAARSAKDGGFVLEARAPAAARTEARPQADDLVAEAPGYVALRLTGTWLEAGGTRRLLLDLEPGTGERTRDDRHKIARQEELEGQGVVQGIDLARRGAVEEEPPAAGDAGPTSVSVPQSIRVGVGCDCASCGAVEVMSLERYVQHGLDDEWIASWGNAAGGRNSLRAGAVAYRSYGAWRVANPLASGYDICSTACCQAFSGDVDSRTQDAARFTDSVVLSAGGNAVFSAKYSSENNALLGSMHCANTDLSCGNGRAGSPGSGWGCVDDPHCANRSCFGHGQGMCQFGSSFWANNGRTWPWILDHYYNRHYAPAGQRSAYLEELPEVAVGRNQDGRLEVIGRRAGDNAPLHAHQLAAGGSAFSAFLPLSGALLSSPALERNLDGRLQLFVRGTGNDVWTAAQASANGAWGEWQPLPGLKASSEPVVKRNANGRLQVFVRGIDHELYTAAQAAAGGAFGAWVPLRGVLTSAPAVGMNRDGRLQVFARGVDDSLWTRWQTVPGGSWADWTPLGGGMASHPAVGQQADGRLVVFARGTEPAAQLWHISQTTPNGAWGVWAPLGDSITSAPAVVSNQDGRLQVFARGASGELRTVSQTAPNGGWSAWTGLGGYCTSAPAAFANQDGRLHVIVRGTDRALWSKFQVSAGGGFSNDWFPLGGTF
jgi:hypothetical protein